MMKTCAVAFLAAILSAPASAQQADAAAMFEQGVSFEDFLADARARRGLWLSNTERAAPSDEMVQRLKAVGDGLRILAIAVDSCSDSVSTVPYLARLAELGGVELRIVDGTVGRAVMEQHRTPDDRAATPTIVLLRGDETAGVFVERPAALQNWFLSDAAQALSQGDRVARKMSWYDWDRGDSTVAEVVALAEANVR